MFSAGARHSVYLLRRKTCQLAILACAWVALEPASAIAFTLVSVVEAERAGRCHEWTDDIAVSAEDGIAGELALAHLARCQMVEGEHERSVRTLDVLDDRLSESGHRIDRDLGWLAEVRARGRLHRGQARRAVSELRALLSSSRSGAIDQGSQARLLYYLGLAQEASGDRRGARESYNRLATQYPASEYVSRVAPLLVELRPGPQERLDMALAALRGRQYEAAERLMSGVACEGAVPCDPEAAIASGRETPYEAAYQLGFMLFRYRREFVERGLPWLRALAEAPGHRQADAAYYLARALMRVESYDEARAAWDRFRTAFPEDPRAHEATFYLGWLWVDEDRHSDGIPGLEAYLAEYPEGAREQQAHWWLGWAEFREGDCARAISEWEASGGRNAWWRYQVEYWTAVCSEQMGERARAEELWRGLIEETPNSYYSVLAARRLGLPLVEGLGNRVDAALNAWSAPDALRDPVLLGDEGLTAEATLLLEYRDDLREAEEGLDDLAKESFEMHVEADRGDWNRWRHDFSRTTRSMPNTVDALQRWQLAYPRFYAGAVDRFSGEYGIEPSMIWAVMQQESSFDRHALSVSDAMGLMQVIPQTAERISERLGDSYVDGMLFEPWHAVRYGGWYLSALVREFHGQIPLAIGAYNAGPTAMGAWLDRSAGMPMDEFVEEISYDQARDYIKRVLTWMLRYEIASGRFRVLESPTLGGMFPLVIEGGREGDVRF